MNEINFGMDGFSLDNTTWYNPKNNDVVKIRSNYFEDNNMVIQTYDGRVMNLNQLSNYVQWTGKGEPPKTPQQEKPIDTVPPEIAAMVENNNEDSYLDPEDMAMISGIPMTSHSEIVKPQYTKPSKSPNYDIIDRALNKTKQPKIELDVKWNKFPSREIEMLIDIMDIPKQEISDYYINNIKDDMNSFIDNIKNQLTKYIEEKLSQNKTDKKK